MTIQFEKNQTVRAPKEVAYDVPETYDRRDDRETHNDDLGKNEVVPDVTEHDRKGTVAKSAPVKRSTRARRPPDRLSQISGQVSVRKDTHNRRAA